MCVGSYEFAVRCKENTAADVTVEILCCVYLWTYLSSFTFKATPFRKVPLHWSATKVRIRWPTKDPEEMYGLLKNVFNIAFITKIISELISDFQTDIRILWKQKWEFMPLAGVDFNLFLMKWPTKENLNEY